MERNIFILLILSMVLSTPAWADKGILRIVTDPGDAKIYVNGKRKGNSPPELGMSFAISLDEGEYTVLAVKPDGEHYEYKGEKKDVFVADDTVQTLSIDLTRDETDAGRIAREAKEEKERQKEKRQREEYFSRIKAQRNYIKLSATGKELPDSAEQWSCVRDNDTGVVWEVKTDDGGIHDKGKKYRWGGKTVSPIAVFKRDNGEYSEKVADEFFLKEQYDDWNSLVDGSNNEGLCGFTDWRVAELDELKSLLYNAGCGSDDEYCKKFYDEPTIAQSYFPNTEGYYWTGTPGGATSVSNGWFSRTYTFYAWRVDFDDASFPLDTREDFHKVRLARGGDFFEKREQDRLAREEKERQEKLAREEKERQEKLALEKKQQQARIAKEQELINNLKSAINKKIGNDQLSRPKGESAIDYILKLESMKKEKDFTNSARLKVSNRYAQLAENVGCKDKKKAMEYIALGKRISPSSTIKEVEKYISSCVSKPEKLTEDASMSIQELSKLLKLPEDVIRLNK